MDRNLDRRTFLRMMGVAGVAMMTPMCSTFPKQKPNVLFIAVDDLRTELGYYGNTVIKTPNIDKLASQGRIFTNHFVQIPTCGASRCSLLIGKRPRLRRHLGNEAIITELSDKPEKEYPAWGTIAPTASSTSMRFVSARRERTFSLRTSLSGG